MKYPDFPFLQLNATKELFKIFRDNSIEARFVGGCVRDAFLNMMNDDLDIAVNKDINQLKELLEKQNIKCVPTGLKYGSITVILNNTKFELTELRRDKECFGRTCHIENITSFEEDAKRRDFTINAIYLSENGEIFDYFNGISDLMTGQVKFIGNAGERIQEDYLRILRYYRFAAKLGDTSDRYSDIIKTFSHMINTISIERVQKELFLILDTKHSFEIFKLIQRNGVFNNLNFENYEKLLEQDPTANTELKAYILFGYEQNINKFKLTKKFKKLIKDFKRYENESLLYCYYKKGKDFANDIKAIKFANYNINESIPNIETDFPKFPIAYKDLPKNTGLASRKLKACERWWVNQLFEPSKEDCLKFIEINSSF